MSGLGVFLQNELLNLSNEAKKKNPEIKDAVEHLLVVMRTVKETFPHVEPGMPDPLPKALSESRDVMLPFTLSFESKNPKLVQIAIGCIQRLISHQAIPEDSVPVLITSLMEQISGPMEIQLKILQTILPVVMNYPKTSGQSFSDALLLSFKLQETKSPIVNTTAAVTFRQLIVHAFERLESLSKIGDGEQPMKDAYANDAFMLFEDLCGFGNNEQNKFLKDIQIERNFALELTESVITSHPQLFIQHEDLSRPVKDKVCPTLIRCFSDKNNFPYMSRLIRLVQSLFKHLLSSLTMECEIFLSIYNKLFDAETTPLWQKVLILEAYKSILADGPLHRAIFESSDHANPTSHPFKDMMMNIGKFIFSVQSYIMTSPSTTQELSAAKADTPGGPLSPEEYALHTNESALRVQCLDQLDKQEVPSFPETYPVFLAIQCIISVTASQYNMIMPTMQRERNGREEDGTNDGANSHQVLLAIELVKESCHAVLAVLLLLVPCSIDDDLYGLVLKAFQEYTTLVGILGLVSFRDALFAALCKASVPPSASFTFDLATNSKDILPLYHSSQSSIRTDSLNISIVSDRNVSAMKVLLSVSETLIAVIDHRVWYAVFETLQIAESLLSSGKVNKRMESSPGLLEVSSPLASVHQAAKDLFRVRSSTMTSAPHNIIMTNQVNPSADNNYQAVIIQAKRLFEKSVLIDMKHMVEFMRALCRLATDTMGGAGMSQVGTPASLKESTKGGEEKSYAVFKIHLVTLLILKRLLEDFEHGVWDMIISQLTTIAQSPNCTATIRAQVCNTFGEILLAASQQGSLSDPRIERRILEPIGGLIGFENSANIPEDKVASHIKWSWFIDVQKSGIEILNKLLQTSGQAFSNGWLLIMDILCWIAKTSKFRRLKVVDTADTASSEVTTNSPSRSLIRVAFPCVQLICADFLPLLSPSIISKCIETVSAYGQNSDDLNMSLASVGLLWTICDFILSKRHLLEKEKAKAASNSDPTSISAESEQLSDNPKDTSAEQAIFTLQSIDSLWMSLLGSLSELCSDDRGEVRNSANQTLFRTLEMKGSKLTPDAWGLCIRNVLIPLLDRIQTSNEKALEAGRSVSDIAALSSPPTRPQSPVLLGAKPTSKSWDETKILTLNGVTKCFSEFLPQIIPLGKELEMFWCRFIAFVTANAVNTSHEVSVASLKSFHQLVCSLKNKNSPDLLLIEENLVLILSLSLIAWDEWIGLGQKIISNSITKRNIELGSMAELPTLSGIQFIDSSFPSQIDGYMSHECLNLWLSIFGEIYEQIRAEFRLMHFKRLAPIILDVLLYQSVPPPGGAAASRYRMDSPSDKDNLSSLQNTLIDILTNEKYPFGSLDYVVDAILPLLADIVKLPFVPSQSALMTPLNGDLPDLSLSEGPLSTTGSSKKFTYVALSKRCVQLIQTLIEKHGQAKDVYESGTKDGTPLWKVAAVTAMDLIRVGLGCIEQYRDDFSADRRDSLYNVCVTVLHEFLLEASLPLTTGEAEVSPADEEFDIAIIKEMKDELIYRFAKDWVNDSLLTRVLKIFESGTVLFAQPAKFAARITPESYFGTSPEVIASNGTVSEPEQGESVVKVSQEKTPVLGTDVTSSRREEFGFACIHALFELSSSGKNDELSLGVRISSFCAPILIEFLKSRIQFYVSEYPQWGDYPMPRIMQKELQVILNSCGKLQLRPSALVRAHPEINDDPVKQKVYTSTAAHVFAIYGHLCDLLAVAHGKHSTSEYAGSEGGDVIKLIKTCLSRITFEIGTLQS